MGMTDDLLHERRCVLEFSLPHFMDFWPDRIAAQSPHLLSFYLSHLMSHLARCYWLGLADEVRPRLGAILEWMEGREPPDFVFHATHNRADLVLCEERQAWWETLGLCKWLVRDDAATDELSKALFAEWDTWQKHKPEKHRFEIACRQSNMSHTLALALAAGRPEFGAHMYGLVRDWDPEYEQAFKVRYGHWACVHLAHGGMRDGEYVRSGIEVLQECTRDSYSMSPSREHLLWLKLIWFDTGLATTAEEAVLREFDVTGSWRRPSFVQERGSFL